MKRGYISGSARYFSLLFSGVYPASSPKGKKVVVFRRDSPGKAAQWMGRSIVKVEVCCD
jgi:hypothetical protein